MATRVRPTVCRKSAGGLHNTAPAYTEYPLVPPGAPRAIYGTIDVKF